MTGEGQEQPNTTTARGKKVGTVLTHFWALFVPRFCQGSAWHKGGGNPITAPGFLLARPPVAALWGQDDHIDQEAESRSDRACRKVWRSCNKHQGQSRTSRPAKKNRSHSLKTWTNVVTASWTGCCRFSGEQIKQGSGQIKGRVMLSFVLRSAEGKETCRKPLQRAKATKLEERAFPKDLGRELSGRLWSKVGNYRATIRELRGNPRSS